MTSGALTVALAGCASGQPAPTPSQAPVTLHLLLDANLIDLFGGGTTPSATPSAPVIPTFQAANPNIKLDIETGAPRACSRTSRDRPARS